MTTKNITVLGLDTCSYTKSLKKAFETNTPPKHLDFTYIECGSEFERQCGGSGKSCSSDQDCKLAYKTSEEDFPSCDLTPAGQERKELCNVQGFPAFKNESLETCHLGYEATDHDGFLRKMESKC